MIANNLGSDLSTRIVDSSLGHVLQGAGAQTGLAAVHFANGDDRPYWGYTFQLNPGETKSILNFATGQLSKAAAREQAMRMAKLPADSLRCLTPQRARTNREL